MANVLFKRGTEAKLLSLTSYDDGCFYLTSDTHRLYTGVTVNGTVQLEAVNEGVTTVENTTALPDIKTGNNYLNYQGRFYYISSSNILAVCSGKEWVHINPDTRLDLTNSKVTAAMSGTSQANVTTQIKDSSLAGTNKFAGGTVGIAVDGDLGISVTAGENGNPDVITLSYTTPDKTKVELVTAESKANNTVNGMTIDVKQDATSVGTATIKAGTNMSASVSGKELTLSAKDMRVKTITAGAGNGIAAGQEGASTNGFNIEITDDTTSVKRKVASFNPQIKTDGQTGTTSFVNGTATIDAYSKGTVDNMIAAAKREIDAMQYKGTVSTKTAVEALSTKSAIGDTYKVSAKIIMGEGVTYYPGDLLICQGTEGTDGLITSASFTLDYVPSGNDYSYKGEHSSSENLYTSSIVEYFQGTKGDSILTTSIKGDSSNIKISAEEDDNENPVITVSHIAPAASTLKNDADITQATKGTASFTAITGIDYDSTGHVKGYKTGKITVKDTDTHNALNDLTHTNTVGTNNTEISVKTTLDTADKDVDDTVTFSSSTLQFTTDADKQKVIIDLVWGEF
jgi:peptide deformylase